MSLFTSDRLHSAVLLLFATATYTSLLCFELYGLRPSNAEAYNDVSSFYGPGSYLAWWLTALSVIMSPASPEDASNYSWLWRLMYRPDIVTSVLYLVFVAFDTIFRTVSQSKDFAEVDAGLTVLEAGADLCILYLFVTSTQGFTRVLTLGLLVASIFFHHITPIANQSLSPINSSSDQPIASLALDNRNYKLAAGVNLFVVLFVTSVWMFADFPLALGHQRLITACSLAILWLLSNELGTYEIMPRSSATLDQLDQWAPLVGAVILVAFSWTTELKDVAKKYSSKSLTENESV